MDQKTYFSKARRILQKNFGNPIHKYKLIKFENTAINIS